MQKACEQREVDRLLNARSVLALIDCSERCLRRWVACGKFPPPDIRIGRSLRWRASTIREFVESKGASQHE